MPCHDKPRIERATGRPSFPCRVFEPEDRSQWCAGCRADAELYSVDFDGEGNLR